MGTGTEEDEERIVNVIKQTCRETYRDEVTGPSGARDRESTRAQVGPCGEYARAAVTLSAAVISLTNTSPHSFETHQSREKHAGKRRLPKMPRERPTIRLDVIPARRLPPLDNTVTGAMTRIGTDFATEQSPESFLPDNKFLYQCTSTGDENAAPRTPTTCYSMRHPQQVG